MTADNGDDLRYWVHKKQMVKDAFHHLKVLGHREFEVVDWEMVTGGA